MFREWEGEAGWVVQLRLWYVLYVCMCIGAADFVFASANYRARVKCSGDQLA